MPLFPCRSARMPRQLPLWLVVTVVALMASPLRAAGIDRCLAVADAGPPIHRVALSAGEVRLTFVGHATFLIESPKGVRIATDYSGSAGPGVVPDIVTMNIAHDSHWTGAPDPKIKHVLQGWNPKGGRVRHDLTVDDTRVRNVPTNLRGDDSGTAYSQNSIFIFELAGLCIAHLGHLHHTLTPEHLGMIGQMDVVLVPVDGGYTLDLPGMMEVLKKLRPRLIVPMHYFGTATLARFTDRVKADFPVRTSATPCIVLSQKMLPRTTEVLVLPEGEYMPQFQAGCG